MTLLLLGKNGQVGWELQRALSPLGAVTACGRDADLLNPAGLRALIREVKPAAIVNAAAYTAVDRAESEPDLAQRINCDAPAVLAEEAARLGAWLVHYSTDYVFDGTKTGAYAETDVTAPINVYGRTKRDGEAAIMASGCHHLIFRTSWVHGAHGGNFIKTMLRLAAERSSLRVVADQIGAPTGAELTADVTAHALRCVIDRDGRHLSGLYHLAAAGETCWRDFAALVLAEAQRLGASLKTAPEAVEPIKTSDYPTLARRPANSRLDTQKLRKAFGIYLPPWQAPVQRVVAELIKQ